MKGIKVEEKMFRNLIYKLFNDPTKKKQDEFKF